MQLPLQLTVNKQSLFLRETICEQWFYLWGKGTKNCTQERMAAILILQSASRLQLCKVPFVLLQPLVQSLGLGVELQGQINVPVRFQGIEAEHVGQVSGPHEAKLLIFFRSCLEAQNPLYLPPPQPW